MKGTTLACVWMPLTALGMPFQPVLQSYILLNISKLALCMASHLHCGDYHGFSTQDTADYLHRCLPRDVTHRQVLWQSRRVHQALAASALQRSPRGGVSLRPSLAACRNEGHRNFVPSGSRASDTVMYSDILRLGRRQLARGCAACRAAAIGHSPAKVLTRRHKHPSSGERRGNIYSLKLI